MHKTFRRLLEDATGLSEFVIVVNVDIRGFSSFCKTVESPAVAMFIKRVYMKIIDDYFHNPSFFKSTGDGLLITIPYREDNLQDTIRKTINSCFQILRDFGSLCANDPVINFDVPRTVGIGLSRGTACRLVSKDKILDYSGRVLNLASRLMDLARPAGIVFDTDFGIELLSDKKIELFDKASVYIKGIAEREPIGIYYTKNSTRIPSLSKQPLEKIKWNEVNDTKKLREIKDYRPSFLYELPTQPLDRDELEVQVTHPFVVRGRKRGEVISSFPFSDFEYFLEANKPRIRINFDSLAKRLEANGVKVGWDVGIKIMYPER